MSLYGASLFRVYEVGLVYAPLGHGKMDYQHIWNRVWDLLAWPMVKQPAAHCEGRGIECFIKPRIYS